jgi:hypothetical protein
MPKLLFGNVGKKLRRAEFRGAKENELKIMEGFSDSKKILDL